MIMTTRWCKPVLVWLLARFPSAADATAAVPYFSNVLRLGKLLMDSLDLQLRFLLQGWAATYIGYA
jgi:hypothetical protein